MHKNPFTIECVPATDVLTDAAKSDIRARFPMFTFTGTQAHYDELLIARQDGRMVGVLAFQDFSRTLYLSVVEVDDDCRRQGIGAALTDRFRAMAHERGCEVRASAPVSPGGRGLAARRARLAAQGRNL